MAIGGVASVNADLPLSSMQGVTIPIFGEGTRAVAVLKIERIQTVHQRRAFFRIGLLKEVEIEKAELKLISEGSIDHALNRVAERLKLVRSEADFVMRGFRITRKGTPEPLISATAARVDASLVWTLSNVDGSLIPTELRGSEVILVSADHPTEFVQTRESSKSTISAER